ncbi:MAG: hypothetical protein NVS1B7_6760 [Candidatus Saccharimonadales bacterium]
MRNLQERSALIMESMHQAQMGSADIMQTDDILVNSLLKPDYQAPSLFEALKASVEEREVNSPVISYVLKEAEISCAGLASRKCHAEVKHASLREIQ